MTFTFYQVTRRKDEPENQTGQTGEPAGLAVGAEALRATAIASQATKWPEHLDLRSHRRQKIEEATWLFTYQTRNGFRIYASK